MKNYAIIGYGKFGRLALERLLASDRESTLTVVERNADRIRESFPQRVTVCNQDAISFLLSCEESGSDDVIIPMVPFHLAASFIVTSLTGCKEIPVPSELSSMVPNPFPVNSAHLCASKADFLCPDDCPEGDLCTVTGLPREPLFEELEGLEIPSFTVLVQRSFQILPGVGGYRFRDLLDMRQRIDKGRYLVATSCKCHAVLSALEVD